MQSLDDAGLYINREISLLEFHQRVLEQAKDPETPVLERLRFLCISSSILDEFFEIRVGALREQVAYGLAKSGPDGLGAKEALEHIRHRVQRLVAEQYRLLNEELLPALEAEGIVLYARDRLSPDQREWIRAYWKSQVMPVLTPLGLDPAHPFPRILNKSLNYLVSVDGKDAFGRKSQFAVIQ
ncbi:MAG: RNA degradosome polyphosphate kinase, partial [Gemmatimonadetes bacterium]|nr:RNA degradosome polyphosphate kinase [Gemmatimonadota bacterium]